jgi:hypothetical protein
MESGVWVGSKRFMDTAASIRESTIREAGERGVLSYDMCVVVTTNIIGYVEDSKV